MGKTTAVDFFETFYKPENAFSHALMLDFMLSCKE